MAPVVNAVAWCDTCEDDVDVEFDTDDPSIPRDGTMFMVEFIHPLCGTAGLTFEDIADPIGDEEKKWEQRTGR